MFEVAVDGVDGEWSVAVFGRLGQIVRDDRDERPVAVLFEFAFDHVVAAVAVGGDVDHTDVPIDPLRDELSGGAVGEGVAADSWGSPTAGRLPAVVVGVLARAVMRAGSRCSRRRSLAPRVGRTGWRRAGCRRSPVGRPARLEVRRM